MIRSIRNCSLRRKEVPGNGNVGGTAEVISSQICRDTYLGLFMHTPMQRKYATKSGTSAAREQGNFLYSILSMIKERINRNERKTGKDQGRGTAKDFRK